MSVYYVHASETGLLKIGFAKLPHQRLGKMQVDSPTRLVLLAVEQGSVDTEKARHRRFASLRARGEWFRFEGALRDYVDRLEAYVAPTRAPIPGPLGAWIRANGHTLDSFASLVGSTHPTICRVCHGGVMPRRELLIRIVEATNWAVDANALLGVPAKPAEAQAA